MITGGCDVGSLTSKGVLMQNNKIIGSEIIKSKVKPQDSANTVMAALLEKSGMSVDDVKFWVGTGYGRDKIDFVGETLSEIACHGKGAKWLLPATRTVIDIGGQDAKTFKIDENGHVERFLTNDKCASGTGRFLEVMAKVLGLEMEEMGSLSAKADSPITFAASCTVWAQADVIKYLNSGYKIENIAAGINNAMASRVAVLVSAINAEKELCMTGGVAKNKGVVSALEKLLGQKIRRVRKQDPQLAGAIGAAIYAFEKLNKENTL